MRAISFKTQFSKIHRVICEVGNITKSNFECFLQKRNTKRNKTKNNCIEHTEW
jgi:hypothetical protein